MSRRVILRGGSKTPGLPRSSTQTSRAMAQGSGSTSRRRPRSLAATIARTPATIPIICWAISSFEPRACIALARASMPVKRSVTLPSGMPSDGR